MEIKGEEKGVTGFLDTSGLLYTHKGAQMKPCKTTRVHQKHMNAEGRTSRCPRGAEESRAGRGGGAGDRL